MMSFEDARKISILWMKFICGIFIMYGVVITLFINARQIIDFFKGMMVNIRNRVRSLIERKKYI